MRWSLLASILTHVLIVVLFRQAMVVPEVAGSAAGRDAADEEAAAGGGMEVVAIRVVEPPPEPEEVVTPVPVTVEPVIVEPIVVRPPTPQPPAPTSGQSRSEGEDRGDNRGPGTDEGTGAGAGGEDDAGDSAISAPRPRGLILPPGDRPASARGKTITVYVFVTDQGRVVADSTRLNPSSGDRGYDNRLRRDAADWVFNPARQAGRAVAAWFQYVIVL
jgi:outer membrane biosynthesis protein TonB